MKTEIKALVRNQEGNFIVVTQTVMPNGAAFEGTLRGQFTEHQLLNQVGMTTEQVSNLLSV